MSATSIDLSQIKTDALSAASTFRTLIGLGTSDTPTFKAATLSAGTLNGTALDIAQTWGGTGTYTGLKYNVTDSGPANAASLLMDLQVGGTSQFKVSKTGVIDVGDGVTGQPSVFLQGVRKTIYFGYGFGGGFIAGANSSFNTQWFHVHASKNQVSIPSGSNYGWQSGTTNSDAGNDLALWRDAANTLAQRNGTNAQTFRIYNTTDAGLTNYERAKIAWESNVLKIGTEGLGTGAVTPRSMEFQTAGTTRLTIGATGDATFTGALTAGEQNDSKTHKLSNLYAASGNSNNVTLSCLNNSGTTITFKSFVALQQSLTISGTLDLTIRTVTYGATMAIDAALGNKIAITLAGNGTISNPTNAVDGRVLVFRLRQDATGSRIPVWDTKYAFVGDLATVTLSTAANAIDRIAFEYDSTTDKWYCISFIKGS